VVVVAAGGQVVVPSQEMGRAPPHLTLRGVAAHIATAPAAKLQAHARAIPLLGREAALAELGKWLDSGRPVSVRMLVAPGGAGKTRLALELCDQRHAKGWDAGFIYDGELARFVAQQNLSQWSWQKPTLAVIDYAASRAGRIHTWLSELAYNPGVKDAPLRLLLLDRDSATTDAFRRRAFGEGGSTDELIAALLDPPEPVVLAPLSALDTRVDIFVATRQAVGAKAVSHDERLEIARRLDVAPWGSEPLFVMMAALVSLEREVAQTEGWSRQDLAHAIAKRELARICKPAEERHVHRDLVAQLAACVTLRQGIDADDLADLVEGEAAQGRFGPVIAHDYEVLLKESLGCDGERLQAVRPDFVGEALLLQAVGALDTGPSAKASTRLIMRHADAVPARVIESVIRTCQDFGERRADSTEPRALAWFDALVADADSSRLQLVVNLLPEQTVVLSERAARANLRLLAHVRAPSHGVVDETNLPQLASVLNNLGNRLGNLGQWEASLEAAYEAVSICRKLAETRPDTSLPDLAMSLNNLGTKRRSR
jgi:hypothetical protein